MNMSNENINQLATAIATAIANPDIVNISKIRNPYQEFAFTVADGEIKTIDYSFDFWRMLTLSATAGVTIRLGKSGTPTSIVGAGVGGRLPDPVGAFQITNNSGGPITGLVGLAIGDIFDDRLNISGSLDVSVASVLASATDVTLNGSAGAAVQIAPVDLARRVAYITNLNPVHPCRIADSSVTPTRGYQLEAGETVAIPTTDSIHGISTKPFTIDVSVVFTED